MDNEIYTQTNLLKMNFDNNNSYLLDGLLKSGVYLLVGTSKIGKSLLATDLANAVSNGTTFLSHTVSNGKVIYFENDNYVSETNNRIIALGYQDNDNLVFNFKDANSFNSITSYLKTKVYNDEDIKLVVVDSLANLSEISDTDQYKSNYDSLKRFCKFIIDHSLCCIIIHHSKKGRVNNQDSTLGSRALTGAVTGTVLIDVDNEFSNQGYLKFITRSTKEIIPIKKNPDGISWIFNTDDNPDDEETIDYNTLSVIKALVKANNFTLEGSCQELCEKMNLDINPKGLLKFLNRNQKLLEDNCVSFSTSRSGNGRFIKLKYTNNDSCDSLYCTKQTVTTVTENEKGEKTNDKY